ncbi:hypothetical protein [Curtobacterium sp. PhB130]|uniref:hypothetical protein n=1 Tax=Curtobacterium sp. PhB130 TaxID=2485178 RepID=UPI0011CD9B3C|nr:hypothetical protein [Curtobacterium sp. PhB130]
MGSGWFDTWVRDEGGIWQAVSAVFTVVAVLIAIWATFRVLEEERKSRLKDEMRAVREALAGIIQTRGDMEGALYPFWKLDAAAWPERDFPYGGAKNPFEDPGVQQEARVTETAYRIIGAGEVLTASVRGAHSMGNSVWARADVDRLTQWISSYANRAWKLPYFLLVSRNEESDQGPWTGYRLVDESTLEDGSPEYAELVAQQFASGKLPGLAPGGPARAEMVTGFYEVAEKTLIRAVSAFLALGDAAAEDHRPLRRRRAKSFLRGDGPGDDLLAVGVEPHRVENVAGTLHFEASGGKSYRAETYAGILMQIWTDYSLATENEPLALGRRQMAAARLAARTNRGTLDALEASGIEPSADEREILLGSTFTVPEQFTGAQPFEWRLGGMPLVLVDDLYNVDCYEPGAEVPTRPIGNVRFLNAQTERLLLESIGRFVPATVTA